MFLNIYVFKVSHTDEQCALWKPDLKAILGHDDTLRLGASWPTHSIPNLLKLRATEMADSGAMHWLCLGRAGQFHSGLQL